MKDIEKAAHVAQGSSEGRRVMAQRYSITYNSEGDAHLYPTDSGDYVLYADHERELAAKDKENERLKAPVSESWPGIADAKKGFDAAHAKEDHNG